MIYRGHEFEGPAPIHLKLALCPIWTSAGSLRSDCTPTTAESRLGDGEWLWRARRVCNNPERSAPHTEVRRVHARRCLCHVAGYATGWSDRRGITRCPERMNTRKRCIEPCATCRIPLRNHPEFDGRARGRCGLCRCLRRRFLLRRASSDDGACHRQRV